jgi:hypothetical protein
MPYRGPHAERIGTQSEAIFTHAGQTVTWRRFVSASGTANAAGFGAVPQFREQTVLALIGPVKQPEAPGAAGTMVSGELFAVLRERPSRRDELVWRGIHYRVESDPAPASLAGTYTMTLKRSDP